MIDRESIDLAGLEAVGLLDPQEQTAFAHEHRVNPELQAASAEMHDLVARLAAAGTPFAALPPQALNNIYARITSAGASAPTRRQRPVPTTSRKVTTWLPWALAAGFALLAAWQGWNSSSFVSRQANAKAKSRNHAQGWAKGSAPGTADGTEGAQPGTPQGSDQNTVGPGGRPRVPPKFFTNREGASEVLLEMDVEKLRSEVARLRATEHARQNPPAGGLSLQMIEMLPPGVRRSTDPKEQLASRVDDVMAAGLEPPKTQPIAPNPDDASEPIEMRIKGSRSAADIHIPGGEAPDLHTFNIRNDQEVRHLDFPPPEAYERLGYTLLNDGTVYDGRDGLWYLSENGIDRIGKLAPDDWRRPDPGESDPGPAPPRMEERSEPSPDTASPEAGTIDPTVGMPYALPLLKHDGTGTLVLQNIPTAPEGQFYQLWMYDQRSEEPIKVRAIPPLQNGTDRIGFELTTPGFIPAGYLMTLEDSAGSVRTPSNRVILQGP